MASTRHSSRYVMRKPRCSLAQAKHRDMRASRVRFGSMCVCVPLSARTRPGLRGLSVHSGHTHCIATLGNRQTPGLFSQRETIRNRAMRALTFRSHHYRSTLAPRGPGCRTRLSGSLWGGLPQWVHGAVSSSKLILSTTHHHPLNTHTHTHTHLTANTMTIYKRSTCEQWASLRGHDNACERRQLMLTRCPWPQRTSATACVSSLWVVVLVLLQCVHGASKRGPILVD
jgi:hypothetical protein